MKTFNLQPSTFNLRRSRSGVALIITVIMLSVITFLAVAFLALSGREKGAVKTATDQTTARLAADTAMVRAQADLLAGILAARNLENYDILVSTNFRNWEGYDTSKPVGVPNPTNVNYFDSFGNPLAGDNARQNLANLFYNPSVPVFITNRFAANSMEFRDYIDLNRNGRLDLTGFWGVTNVNAGSPFPVILTNGLYATNYVTGDPQWIGALERIELPHSGTNKFSHRFAYAVVPVGKTLDLNYIHNQARAANAGSMDSLGRDFFRNQGVAPWEINLAAFLYDLNTNSTYGWGLNNIGYFYDPLNGSPIQGNAFVDAGALYRYRLNGNPNGLAYNPPSVNALYGGAFFDTDYLDGYSDDGQVLSTNGLGLPASGLLVDNDNQTRPWLGADQPNHFFTTQDLFDPNKVNRAGAGYKFTDRLLIAGTNASTYDQYTYYRLLSQLGTDSAPDGADKLNLNYINIGGRAVTNFIPWTDTNTVLFNFPGVVPSEFFFTNVADRILRAYTEEWIRVDPSNYLATYCGYIGYTGPNDPVFGSKVPSFGITNIPVSLAGTYSPTNQVLSGNRLFTYTPAVHRLLQIAANIWDAQADRRDPDGPLPTVFAPRFAVSNQNIYITGFVEANRPADLSLLPPLDLSSLGSNSVTSLVQNDSLIFGVPLVIGARKGLPNFNEYAAASVFTLTRKIQLEKSAPGGQTMIHKTNQLFTLDIFMDSATEFWNSYQSNYLRPVDILITNRITMALKDRGSVAPPILKTFLVSGTFSTNNWVGWKDYEYGNSFVVPLRTNLIFLPTVTYRPDSASFGSTNLAVYTYDESQNLRFPSWLLSVTNRVQAMILNRNTGEIIDYALLGEMNSEIDLAAEIGRSPALSLAGLWGTNANSGRPGVLEQIRISKGVYNDVINNGEWSSQAQDAAIKNTTISAGQQIANFLAFFTPNQRSIYTDPSTGVTYNGTNDALVAEAPFTPSVKVPDPWSWQANDPLVHYNAKDMLYLAGVEAMAEDKRRIKPPQKTYAQIIADDDLKDGNAIGRKHQMFKPWGEGAAPDPQAVDPDPGPIDLTLKDPLVRSSDDWQFPTNKFPTVGWLGRIHRGTPWQTIYLKSSDMGLSSAASNYVASPLAWANNYQPYARKWAKWTGNRTLLEGYYTRPVSDRLLFDLFTTALNDNAGRGQLSVNQTNLAAWSAVFGGAVALRNASLTNAASVARFEPVVIEPAGVYDPNDTSTWPPLVNLVHGINAERLRTDAAGNFVHPGGWFQGVGDLLSVPELTDRSPFLNTNGLFTVERGVSDAAYEWLPQQIMSLVKLGEPRFVIYAYGQALRPAENSIVTSGGAFFGMCTNYQITAEVAARAVVRVEGSANPNDKDNPNPKRRYPPRLVVESYNYLPPE